MDRELKKQSDPEFIKKNKKTVCWTGLIRRKDQRGQKREIRGKKREKKKKGKAQGKSKRAEQQS